MTSFTWVTWWHLVGSHDIGLPVFKEMFGSYWNCIWWMTVNQWCQQHASPLVITYSQYNKRVKETRKSHQNKRWLVVKEFVPFSAARLSAARAWYWITGYSDGSSSSRASKASGSSCRATLTPWSYWQNTATCDTITQPHVTSQHSHTWHHNTATCDTTTQQHMVSQHSTRDITTQPHVTPQHRYIL